MVSRTVSSFGSTGSVSPSERYISFRGLRGPCSFEYPPEAVGVKRPHEGPPPSSVDLNQDAKRLRMSSAAQSPKTNPPLSQASSPPSQPTPSPVISSASAGSSATPQPRPNAMPALNPAALQKAMAHLTDLEKQLKQKVQDANEKQQAGRKEEADLIRMQLQPMFQQYKKMKTFMEHARSKLQEQHQQQQQAAAQSAQSSSPAPANNNQADATNTTTTPHADAAPPSNLNANAPATENLSAAPPVSQAVPQTTFQAHVKPQDAQLQQRQTPRMSAATIPPAQAVPPAPVSGPGPSPVPTVASGSSPLPQGHVPVGMVAAQSSNKHWEGTLAWRGLEHTTHARTELQTKVTLVSAPGQELG